MHVCEDSMWGTVGIFLETKQGHRPYNTPLLRKRPKKDPVRLPFPPMEGQGILFAAAAWR